MLTFKPFINMFTYLYNYNGSNNDIILPNEIILHILSFIPPNNRILLSTINKSIHNTIIDNIHELPENMYKKLSTLNYIPLKSLRTFIVSFKTQESHLTSLPLTELIIDEGMFINDSTIDKLTSLRKLEINGTHNLTKNCLKSNITSLTVNSLFSKTPLEFISTLTHLRELRLLHDVVYSTSLLPLQLDFCYVRFKI
ncbi:F-box domain-containing protein with Leucine-rich repeat [Orpheovirus IHUMI-LCC2]|uniref:F-box domain-containing protein with Leucine-rich repeat n=1 Tax=Orpheovirus IHUMI-LCC2 TaxID=2023057 RepID=A0A2I2L6A7_9VIRU|nr:F-box domain-containing protein with Leucine-rich repeat [Orpheovirus IHUMI-LCC2]SNW63085.1 F-box domain-containing protein with Leucine-rich repeat [Orpheovirus IHUMI-LCC2]